MNKTIEITVESIKTVLPVLELQVQEYENRINLLIKEKDHIKELIYKLKHKDMFEDKQ